MLNAQNSLPERLHQLCPEIEPMVNTERRSSVDIKKGASPDINGRPSKDDISSSGGLQLSRDLYSLKMKNGLPLSELAKHIPPAVDDSTDYR